MDFLPFPVNPFSLDSKVCIVTGGSGHLGSCITSALAAAGASVYALSRSESDDDADCSLPELPGVTTGQIFPTRLDVSDRGQFKEFVDSVEKEHGRIDCLINNANSSLRQPLSSLTHEEWVEGFRGTADHIFSCTQAILPSMRRARNGCVINTGSLFAFLAPQFPLHLDLGNAAAAHHSAAKGAVLQLTRHLAAELGTVGIRVNMVSPGYFPKPRPPERKDYIQEIEKRVPLGRIGQPNEVSGAYVFLASDGASYITGHNLIVDGGYSIW